MVAGYCKVIGAWGNSSGGTPWTDGMYSDIQRIWINHGDVVDAIQVQYIIRGKDKRYKVKASKHGGPGGSRKEIYLQEDEYITKVSGTAGYGSDFRGVVTSLKFTTNKGIKYGPYGKGTGEYFDTGNPGKIVGFFGNSGDLLDKLGFYVLHF